MIPLVRLPDIQQRTIRICRCGRIVNATSGAIESDLEGAKTRAGAAEYVDQLAGEGEGGGRASGRGIGDRVVSKLASADGFDGRGGG
jgi:hypothetical protein